MRIAFLGLGIMGKPMAQNLVKAGHEVKVWNRSSGKVVGGAHGAATPKEAAKDAELVWLCVSDTKAVEQVLFGRDGAIESLKPGTETGQLIFIVGALQETFDKLQPLFSAMGKSAVRVGENGKGLAAKLSMNLMIALTFEGFAEALVLAKKQGVDLQPLMSLINQSMVRSGVVDYKAPFVLSRDFTANFPMRLMHKDIHLMLEAAHQNGVKLPGLETVDKVYESSKREGNSELDYAATLMTLEKAAGVS
jgi:3-hydroxyisobutyrate dehydrogenase-like beta-hydroxyacid dehydrogenase